MSALSYRDWDVWINSTYYDGRTYDGYFELTIVGTLMVPQTLEYLAESYEVRQRQFTRVARANPDIVRQTMHTEEGNLCLRVYDRLDTNADLAGLLRSLNSFLEAVGLATDSPLSSQKIRFISFHEGKLLVANRRSVGRGMAFELEERGTASQKLAEDLDYYLDHTDSNLVVGRRHYMTGMQLLGIEDAVTGLLDAAYMQFYQGCEALCRDPRGSLEPSKQHIAALQLPDSRDLQIIAHQVWRVRHKYFGHGDVAYNLEANLGQASAAAVARQVLVARYLCRRLIDAQAPSGAHLVREMNLAFGQACAAFMGSVQQLEEDFRVQFDGRTSKIYHANGQEIEEYTLA
ncbi:hypothetical protein KBY86_14650 [Synechococcus sp. Lug-A]|nr:hypothetical protein [Synechococcus sp. Lug-A]